MSQLLVDPFFILTCLFLRVYGQGSSSGLVVNATDPLFLEIVDQNAELRVVAESERDFAHEAPVWMPALNKLFFVSNRLDENGGSISGSSDVDQHIELYTLDLTSGNVTMLQTYPEIQMANGAIRITDTEIVILSQGQRALGGGLFKLNLLTLQAEKIVDSFNGVQFNSPNDIIYSSVYDGYFFTDPTYGSTQGFRPTPQLPPSVYFVDRKTLRVKSLIQNMTKPNGVVLSLDSKVLYVSDTGFFVDGPLTDPNAPRAIFTFDVTIGADGLPEVSNQRTFAVVDQGAPDGIRVDEKGNVYAGIGGGVTVYTPDGSLLGKINTPTGVANIAIVDKDLYMLGETRIYAIALNVMAAPAELPPTRNLSYGK